MFPMLAAGVAPVAQVGSGLLSSESILQVVLSALEENKGLDICVLDVRGKSSFADFMVVTSGSSDRHVRALAEFVACAAKQSGIPLLGTEGAQVGEWVLVDLGDVVVHAMKPQAREFYQLEKLWNPSSTSSGDSRTASRG